MTRSTTTAAAATSVQPLCNTTFLIPLVVVIAPARHCPVVLVPLVAPAEQHVFEISSAACMHGWHGFVPYFGLLFVVVFPHSK